MRNVSFGNNTNYINLLTMHNKLQSSNVHVVLFNIRLLTHSSVITLSSLMFCSGIHSVTITVLVFDLTH